MEVYTTKTDKVNLVANFLMNGPPCGWLFLVGMNAGGEGKTMATGEAIELCKKSFGEESIIRLPCNNDSNAQKLVLMKKDSTIVKTIVHVNNWNPHWEFMASEWDAQVARFERSDL
jgi:hypothetical protein